LKAEIIIERHCEKCKRETRQIVEWNSWYEVTASCLELIDVEDGQDQCGETHIFTLSHLRRGVDLMVPFTRCDFEARRLKNK